MRGEYKNMTEELKKLNQITDKIILVFFSIILPIILFIVGQIIEPGWEFGLLFLILSVIFSGLAWLYIYISN